MKSERRLFLPPTPWWEEPKPKEKTAEAKPPAVAACREDVCRCRAELTSAQAAVAATERSVAALRNRLVAAGLVSERMLATVRRGGRLYLAPVDPFAGE